MRSCLTGGECNGYSAAKVAGRCETADGAKGGIIRPWLRGCHGRDGEAGNSGGHTGLECSSSTGSHAGTGVRAGGHVGRQCFPKGTAMGGTAVMPGPHEDG